MSTTQTSQSAYQYALQTINKRQNAVLETIKKHGQITNLGISEILGFPINSITGRTYELRAKGLVCKSGLKKQVNGHSATLWQAVYPTELFKTIEMENH